MKSAILSAVLAVLVLVGPTTVGAQSGDRLVRHVFSEIERRVIDQYYRKTATHERRDDHDGDDARGSNGRHNKKGKGRGKGGRHGGKGKSGSMPPGLARRSSLPPGLAKRSTLPPGLAKRDLPQDLVRSLPPPPKGTRRLIVDQNVVLVDIATNVVLDLLDGVLTGRIR